MSSRKATKRVSKAEWLATALEFLGRGGIESVRVERLARGLGIAKSGFYWHFRDRAHLLQDMLDYWSDEYTGVVTENPELSALEPKRRLRIIAEMIIDHDLTHYDLAMRSWAAQDPAVARRLAEVYDARMQFLRKAFRELGFTGPELAMRTRLFVCYHSWEQTMFWREPKKKLRAMIKRRVELLTSR